MKEKENQYTTLAKLRILEGHMAFNLECFGDYLAKREKYKTHTGFEAIHFYLIQKHHWLPAQVKSMSYEDLRFVLEEEMHGWTLPADAIQAKRQADENVAD